MHLTASISFAAIVSFMIFDPCLIMIFDTKPAPPRRYDIFLARLSWGEAPSQKPAVDGHITHDCTRTVSSVGTSRAMAVLSELLGPFFISLSSLSTSNSLLHYFLFVLSSNTTISRNSNVFVFSLEENTYLNVDCVSFSQGNGRSKNTKIFIFRLRRK